MAEAVRKDVNGIGYNNIGFAFDQKTLKALVGLAIIPIDINGNGKLDPEEDFYSDRKTFMEAVAKGLYPSPPSRELFLVSKGTPAKKESREFIKWILSDGQRFVEEAGYVGISQEKLKAEQAKLN